jgi:hypothetical protein
VQAENSLTALRQSGAKNLSKKVRAAAKSPSVARPSREREFEHFDNRGDCQSQIYYLIKSYCEGGVGCYYSASSRAGTARLYTVRAGRREDLRHVLRANDDTGRCRRGSPGRLLTRRPGSPAISAFPIGHLKVGGRFNGQLKDYRVDRATVESQRPGFDRIQEKPQPRAWRLCTYRRKDG